MDFNIEESYDKGKIMVSMKDFLPGAELFEENRPLLFLSKEYIHKFERTGSTQLKLGIYNTYCRRLLPRARYKYMQLFGPTEGKIADEIRKQAQQLTTWEQGKQRNFNDKEVNKFIKVLSIWHHNVVPLNSGSTLAVYELLSRMSHSCTPNCAVEFIGMRCVCRVIQHIKSAEELTVSYDSSFHLKPAYERRRFFQELHGFVCQCSRCDSPADDTRQFPCHNPICKGTHSMSRSRGVDCSAVEDYLLPCSECDAPSSEQQFLAALALEKNLTLFAAELKLDLQDDFNAFSVEDCLRLLEKIDQQRYPPGHSLSGALLRCRLRVSVYLSRIKTNSTELLESAQRYVQWLSLLYSFPSTELLVELTLVAARLVESDNEENVVFARDVCLRALRMSLLLHGREDGRMKLDRLLCSLLIREQALHSAPATKALALRHQQKCGYCEESPSNANMTLKRCTRCKIVLYCSVACQKADWKTHKLCCSV